MPRFILLILALGFVASPLQAADIYVSPDGNDSEPGTYQQPVRTLEAARDAARKLRGPNTAVTIWLRDGVYPLTRSVEFSATDSGSEFAPTVIRSFPGEYPLLQAGRAITPSGIRPVSDPGIRKRLQPSAREHAVEIDGKALGLKHLGPWADLVRENGGIVEVLFDGQRLPLARWPNEGSAMMKRVLDIGEEKGPNAHGGSFEYADDRHASWNLDSGLWLTGYWRVPWQIETVRVQAIDREKRSITLAKPVPGGIGSKFARPNGSGKEPYWAVNVLEELDQPGE